MQVIKNGRPQAQGRKGVRKGNELKWVVIGMGMGIGNGKNGEGVKLEGRSTKGTYPGYQGDLGTAERTSVPL